MMITSPMVDVPDYDSDRSGWYAARELQESLMFWRTYHNAGARRRLRAAIGAYRQMIGRTSVSLGDVLLLAIKAQVAQQQVSRFTYG